MGCICCEPSAIKESGERKYDGQGTDAEINSTLEKQDVGILHGRHVELYCSRSITEERIWHGM
uniref:Uncharacterized protein n=1 Tax=Vitis vinifera TaxID=29760 RepID=F6H9L4_VITVI